MDIDKALNPAPLGLTGDLLEQEPALEIEIEDPERVTLESGDMEIILEPGNEREDDDFNSNLVDVLDEGQLTELVGDLIGEYERPD